MDPIIKLCKNIMEKKDETVYKILDALEITLKLQE
jgi:hypothetical protein